VRELLGSEEDALQECALIFVKCKRSYEGRVTNPAWMMALFKQAVVNDWNTMSQKDSRLRALPLPDAEEGIDHNPGFLMAAVSSGSAELQEVVRVIANAPSEFLGMLFNKAEDVNSDNAEVAAQAIQSLNRRVKRLCGIRGTATDVISELRAILMG
jgi:hypothetical protein